MPDTADSPTSTETQPLRSISLFHSLQDEIEHMFRAFSPRDLGWPAVTPSNRDALGLRINVGETDTDIQVTADMPGVSEDNIDVTLVNDLLRISATKTTEDEQEDKTWHVRERSYGRFERVMRIPSGIDRDAIRADYKDGVLTILVPKPAELASASRKIPVSSA